jgi:Holin of 3TMs, for gene-transfer release
MAMALDPITAGIDFASNIVSKIWPDKSAQEQQQLAAVLSMIQGQMDINKAEASNPSTFVSGWRPFIGWVCGLACAWNWIGLPSVSLGMVLYGHPMDLHPADLSEMMPILMGMLGMGGLRTFEKMKGVAAK